ncbi:MAG: polysaccharide biosynthesis tyrosine autokinase [Prevotellaceae bacterium]|jgi:capsular exopolysaccharide synthesis family protein|nr:polysaccharide biosynthesis tyrosine autokinase [Prevotellaceae bacterium]
MEQTNISQSAAVFNEEEQSSFNILEWIFKFLKYWYLFFISATIALAVAYYQNLSWSPHYISESRVLLMETTNSISFMQGFSSQPGGVNSQNNINQQMLLQSHDMISKTIDSMPSLLIDYTVQHRFITKYLYGISPIDIEFIDNLKPVAYSFNYIFTQKKDSSFTIEVLSGKNVVEKVSGRYGEFVGCNAFFAKITPSKYPYSEPVHFKFLTKEALTNEFVMRLQVSPMEKTSSVLRLNLTSGNIKRDKAFLDRHVQTFLDENLAKKNAEAIRTIDFINDQLLYLADSLSSAEANLRAYRVQNNMYESGQFTSNLAKKMESIEEQGKLLKNRDNYFTYLRDYLTKSINEGGIMSPTTLGISDGSLLRLVTEYNALQTKRTEIGVKNPHYASITSQMEQIKGYLFELINSVNSVYEIDRKTYKKEVNEISETLRTAPDKERKLLDLERKFNINDSYYTFLLQKRSEAQMRKAANSPDNSILQKARVSNIINGGDKKEKITMYLIIGLLIPVAFVLLKELLNFKIRTEKDVEKLSQIPLIGSIRHTRHNIDEKIIAAKYPNSIFVETLRVIRTKIELILGRRENFIILISSAESGDGKTYISANLAGTFALQKKRTLLIDFDLRRPSMTQQLENNSKLGFVNYIIGDIMLNEAIVHYKEYGFDFLSAGVTPPNPGEFVRSGKITELFNTLRGMYDYIIIDTSPLGLVADAYAIMPLCDIILIVCRSMKTNKANFKDLAKRLFIDGIKNVYTVLNDFDKGKLGYANSGYGKYGYSYTSSYYQRSENYYVQADFEKEELTHFQKLTEKIMEFVRKVFRK